MQSFSVSADSLTKLTILDGQFFKPRIEKCTDTQIVAVCVKCEPGVIEIKGHRRSSSNFLSHLKRAHGDEVVQEYQNCVKRTNRSFKSIKPIEQKINIKESPQKSFEDNILKFVLHSMAPMTIVDNPFFKAIFNDLNISSQGLKLLTGRSLMRKIETFFKENMRSLKEKLSAVKYVSTSANIWSGRRRSFLGVTVHWLDETNFERRSAAIACRRIGNCHSAERIAELLNEIYNEYGLYPTKIRATITDNGNNFLKAFTNYSIEKKACDEEDKINNWLMVESDSESDYEPENDSASEDPDFLFKKESKTEQLSTILPNHIKCCAHTLSLCVSSDVPNAILNSQTLSIIHKRVMAKCNALWKALARPESADILFNILDYTLSRPCETRWNSLYDALQNILQMKDKCQEVFAALEDKNMLTEDDFTYIAEHLECAKPVATALDILQDEKSTYYGTTIPIIFALLHKLDILNQKNWIYCKPISECFLKSVRSRFSEFFNFTNEASYHAVIAALSHPEFKNRWLIRTDTQQQITVMNLFKELVAAENASVTNLDETYKKSSKSDFFDFDEPECLQFFNDNRQEMQILEQYPVIKKIFIKYNTPLSSSAEVDRLFSYATMTNLLSVSDKFSDKNFEIRVLMKANLNLFKV